MSCRQLHQVGDGDCGGSWQVRAELPAHELVHRCMCLQHVVEHCPDRSSKARSIGEPQARQPLFRPRPMHDVTLACWQHLQGPRVL